MANIVLMTVFYRLVNRIGKLEKFEEDWGLDNYHLFMKFLSEILGLGWEDNNVKLEHGAPKALSTFKLSLFPGRKNQNLEKTLNAFSPAGKDGKMGDRWPRIKKCSQEC